MCALVAVGKCIYRKIRITKCGFIYSRKREQVFEIDLAVKTKEDDNFFIYLFIDDYNAMRSEGIQIS
jgi:hypothetical protein